MNELKKAIEAVIASYKCSEPVESCEMSVHLNKVCDAIEHLSVVYEPVKNRL